MITLPQRTNFEFRSGVEINGWPLIHINIGTNPGTGQPLVAKGVVAIGNIAFGVVSIGGAAFGVVTLAVLVWVWYPFQASQSVSLHSALSLWIRICPRSCSAIG